MFPTQQFSERHLVNTAMTELGMIYENIPWSLVVDRAETIAHLYHTDRTKALKRVQLIVKCIESNANSKQDKQEAKALSAVRFLPVLKKPVDYPLPWFGEGHQLLSGKELMIKGATIYRHSRATIETNVYIAGSQVAFVNEASIEEGGCNYINQKTREILQLRSSPSCQQVINHLKLLITEFNSKLSRPQLVTWADRICRQTYEFLDGQIQYEISSGQTSQLHGLQELKGLPCVWTGKQFIEIQAVARGWKLEGPYLYPVPSSLALRKNLTTSLGIKDNFTPEDILGVLSQIKEEFDSSPVSEGCQKLLRELVSLLHSINPDECSKPIMLPDTSFVMHVSTDLAFDDAPWCKPEEHYKFVHDIIPRGVALKLKVKPVRSKKLEKYVSQAELHFRGVPFGQHEELTQRIQNILRDYPFDITVLKELLQNADDAKAKKMYVILDKRTHGKESVLSEDWQQLQGPAMLVWNDSTFTEKNLKGIQQLGLGSKRSDAESIGQYGIGFNVVYHLTDCPSFITGGETLCIMDPHCRFVPEATPEMPGRRFDDLNRGFWDDFPDLKSAYLRCTLKGCPQELLNGSLFRFPLRHTYQLIKSSKIVDHSVSYSHEPLTADRMHRYLNQWAPKMKQALLFLNHVTELCFYVIEDHKQPILSPTAVSYTSVPTCALEHHFEVCISESAQESRDHLYEKIAAFKEIRGSEPCVVRYPLTIIETLRPSMQTHTQQQIDTVVQKTEQWFIQLGIGDLEEKQQTWKYISQVKPKHGIAAPLGSLKFIRSFRGDVFCFLPLPVSCHLPVHVNAHFILNASRRNIWQSTVPGEIDDKSRWNENLIKAISSSYANFLVEAHSYYIKPDPYTDLDTLQNDSLCYYSVFPNWSKGPKEGKQVPEGQWYRLAEDVYRKLANNNACVLATIESTLSEPPVVASVQEVGSEPDVQYTSKWHPLKNLQCPSFQVYFWAMRLGHDDTPLKPILERIGMKITCAPLRIRNNFQTVECDLPETSPFSVYNYYTCFSAQASSNGSFPCAVEATAFHSVAAFKTFSQYLLSPCQSSVSEEFPKPPFGYPLLLTADGLLRNFDEENKVISSTHSQVFLQSLEKFLHPKLLDVRYSTSYFFSPDLQSYAVVQGILSKALPPALQTTHVLTADKYITKSVLISLWACLSNDQTFYVCLESILKCWALLPSTNDQLFSSKNMFLPILPPTSDQTSLTPQSSAVCEVLHHLEMPFLATNIVVNESAVKDYCPQLSDHKRILTNLYHLHQQKDISSAITKDNAEILIAYLQSINFQLQVCPEEYRTSVKALPLFLTIEGNLTSVTGKTIYIWPTYACKAGYSKWVGGRNIVFLDKRGAWAKLGPSNLGIDEIPEEDLYVKYIFPAFTQLSETERFQHLKHIRDNLFELHKLIMDPMFMFSDTRKSLVVQFTDALKAVSCIGREGSQLMHVSKFSTDEKSIFRAFSEHFHFLPECFTSNNSEYPKWMKFFRAIGLRETITKQEFHQFCRETASGKTADPRKASSVLVKYLFSKEATDDAWYDDSEFVSGVSTIPFVCTEDLQNLSWIHPVHPAPNTIKTTREEVYMTELQGAVLSEHGNIVWTVKCVVHLPCQYWQTELLLKLKVVTQPSTNDVIQNIAAIARSRFADISLFDKYSDECRPPKGAEGLIQVMVRHFEFLQVKVKGLTDDELGLLKDLSCIPVYATPKHNITSRGCVVLTKPSHVLVTGDIIKYFPFLHRIPDELFAVHSVLEKIGVESSPGLSHMRVALETAFNCSDHGQLTLDVNTKHVVQELIKTLYALLKEQKVSKKTTVAAVEAALDPLYLPSEEGTLVYTSSLLYCDWYNYRGYKLKLSGTGLSLLNLMTNQWEGIPEDEFCKYLPERVRPKGLSKCCKLVVPKCCIDSEVEESSTAKSLQTTFGLPNFSKNMINVIKHVTGNEQLCKDLDPIITQFFQTIRTVTVHDLRTDILLQTREPNLLIGSVKVDFHLQKEEKSWCFYLDSKISAHAGYGLMDLVACQSLAEHLIAVIKSQNADVSHSKLQDLKDIITTLLKAQTPQELHFVLGSKGIKVESEDIQFETDVTPKLGRPIPQSWHHRLDQDIHNLFHPEEWVGYENREDHFVFAQVIHPVMEEDCASSHDVETHIHMKYKIYASEDDEEGKEVSALDLYKFLRGKKAGVKKEKSKILLPYKGETDGSQPRHEAREDVELKTMKQQLCEELQVIWRLPSNEKFKAIRRLYLKWHPDKNPDRPELAEEVFKFLQNQINCLEQGLPLVGSDELPQDAPRDFYSQWTSYYKIWDHTAHQHSHYRESEHHFRARGGGGRGDAGFTRAEFPFDEEIGPQPNPEEGRRWVRQAEVDFRTLVALLERAHTSYEVSASVCFMAHEVAEKALKGGMYGKCGLGDMSLKSHNLTPLAYALQAEEPFSTLGLAGCTIPLESYYLDTRFPNRYPNSTTIPSDHYSPQHAQQAKENAERILDMMKALFEK